MTRKIIVVDDDHLITSTLSSLFEIMMNCEVRTYNNPLEVLEDQWVLDNEVEMVITDFLMPKLNGYELIKKIGLICPNAINILLTGYADKGNAIKFINESDLYYYLEKPWDNSNLLKIVGNGFDKFDLETEVEKSFLDLEKTNFELNRLYTLLESNYEQVQNKVIESSLALQSIFDNVDQGFLAIDSELKVMDAYSLECLNIFGHRIENRVSYDLLYSESEEANSFYKELLEEIMGEERDEKVFLYLSLLPSEIVINRKNIEIEYKIMEQSTAVVSANKTILVILTDITEKRILEDKIEHEKLAMGMVAQSVKHFTEVYNLIVDYEYFVVSSLNFYESAEIKFNEYIQTVYRTVHTFKGSFQQNRFVTTPQKLHVIEDKIKNFIIEIEHKVIDEQAFIAFVEGLNLNHAIEEDVIIVNSILGREFLLDSKIAVKKTDLLAIENKLNDLNILEGKESMLSQIRRLRYKSFAESLLTYNDFTRNLGTNYNKVINDFTIIGEDFLIDQDIYSGVMQSLVHVFKNIVIHGIETEEDRLTRGKDLQGEITISFQKKDDRISLSIRDDGAGIDVEKLKLKLLDHSIGEAYVLDSIFSDGVTSAESTNIDVGRGVGLSAVKGEVTRLGGHVKMFNHRPNGSEVLIEIPYLEVFEENLEVMLSPLLDHFNALLFNNTAKIVNDKIDMISGSAEENIFISIYLSGKINGKIVVIVHKGILRTLDSINFKYQEDIKSDIENLAKEIVNQAVGNALKEMAFCSTQCEISTPFILTDSDIENFYKEKSNWKISLLKDHKYAQVLFYN